MKSKRKKKTVNSTHTSGTSSSPSTTTSKSQHTSTTAIDSKEQSTKSASIKDLQKPKLLFAQEAEENKKYLNWTKQDILVRTGNIETNGDLGFVGYSRNGDYLTLALKPYYPLRDDPEEVKSALIEYERGREILERKCGIREKAESPKINPETGQPIVKPKRSASTRRNVNSSTGYGEGTDGNRFCLVILKHGTSKEARKKCVNEIQQLLSDRFDEKKARALAQSWYSTVKRKRPDLWEEK